MGHQNIPFLIMISFRFKKFKIFANWKISIFEFLVMWNESLLEKEASILFLHAVQTNRASFIETWNTFVWYFLILFLQRLYIQQPLEIFAKSCMHDIFSMILF